MQEDQQRPSKKQRELLHFIENFIVVHGYGPSYREIMNGAGYRSVSTVAVHVDNLIKRGHLRKRDYSARSLELVASQKNSPIVIKNATKSQEKWLVDHITAKFTAVQTNATISQKDIDNLYVLVGALYVLGFADAARAFRAKLAALAQK